MPDRLYKKSIFGLIMVAAFGIAVFLNNPQNQASLNKKGLESANISEIGKKTADPEIPGLDGASEEAIALENSSGQSSGDSIENLLKNF